MRVSSIFLTSPVSRLRRRETLPPPSVTRTMMGIMEGFASFKTPSLQHPSRERRVAANF